MKKVLLAVLVTATLGCGKINKETKSVEITTRGTAVVIEVDSCEYVVWNIAYAGGIVHKQNCKFCKQRSINPINK